MFSLKRFFASPREMLESFIADAWWSHHNKLINVLINLKITTIKYDMFKAYEASRVYGANKVEKMRKKRPILYVVVLGLLAVSYVIAGIWVTVKELYAKYLDLLGVHR